MAARFPDELTCDMAETYHALDWRALGLPLAATLAAGLRENSRTRMALAGSVSTVDTLLLGAAVDALHLLVWGKTKDGQKGRSRPEPVVNRWLAGRHAHKLRQHAAAPHPPIQPDRKGRHGRYHWRG